MDGCRSLGCSISRLIICSGDRWRIYGTTSLNITLAHFTATNISFTFDSELYCNSSPCGNLYFRTCKPNLSGNCYDLLHPLEIASQGRSIACQNYDQLLLRVIPNTRHTCVRRAHLPVRFWNWFLEEMIAAKLVILRICPSNEL